MSSEKSSVYLKQLMTFIRPYRKALISSVFTAMGGVVFTLLIPVIVGQSIDLMIGPAQVDFSALSRYILLLGGMILAGSLCQWSQGLLNNHVAYRTVRDLRVTLFRKLNRVPLKVIDGNPHGDFISRMVNDIDQISDGLLQGFNQLFTGMATILGTLCFMLFTNVKIGLVVILVTPVSLFAASFIAKRSFALFKEQTALKGELSSCIGEHLGNQKVVKAFGREGSAIGKFMEIDAKLYSCGVKAQFYSSLTNPCTRFVNGLVYAAVGITGALAVLSGGMTVGALSCFLSYANQYTKPFNEITGVITEFQTALACSRRVFAFLANEEEPSDEGLPRITEAARNDMPEVKFQSVDFSYNPERPLIQDLSLSVEQGWRVAIVGPTGCGKTTLINLLMRFYDVTKGELFIMGQGVESVNRESLRSQFGMVLQDTWLFSGTIFENIAYSKPGATRSEVEKAARLAHAHSFIRRLEQGYDTLVSETGGNLSEGQKQLLCIARIMLTQPPMLILDEATSSIDTRTEIQLQKAFHTMMEGRTTFIVAHRLSTIKEADLILVMDSGRIVEQGTHEELLKSGGFYHKLYYSQFEPVS